MEQNYFIYFISLIGVLLIYFSYCIAIKHQFIFIRTINQETLRRMKNKEKAAKDFGTVWLIFGLYFLVAPLIIMINELGFIIFFFGAVVIGIIETVLELSVEGKIRKGKY